MASDDVNVRLRATRHRCGGKFDARNTAAFIREEADKWAPIVKSTGAQIE